MTRVLIADDHPIILSGAAALLRGTRFDVVAKFVTGAEVLAGMAEVEPDILVLDVQMPECTGLNVLRILRGRNDTRPVILLTAGIDDRQAMDAIAMGVNGLVLKGTAPETLLECLEVVSSGGRWIDPTILEDALTAAARGQASQASWSSLSPRERSVAELVITGLRNREIAVRLGITEGTVKVHLYKVYEKLGIRSRTELVLQAKSIAPDRRDEAAGPTSDRGL